MCALILMAGGSYLALRYFDQAQNTLVTQRAQIQSAEGKLLEALKQESEQKISEKEQAIDEIQGRLSEMNQERERLIADSQEQLKQREEELRLAMEQALIEERSKLREQGVSETEISSRLGELEQQKELEFNTTLETVRLEAQAEIEARESTLNQLMGEYEQALTDAESDREELKDQLTRQEAELLAQFEQKEAELESERLEALQELDSIRTQQEREVLVLDQILSFYGSVRSHLTEDNFESAFTGLQELKAYLNQTDVAVLPAVTQRRQVELFLIDSLENLIEKEQDAASPDTLSLIQSADMVAAATALVERGNNDFVNENFAEAHELYLSALGRIPAVKLGYDRMRTIESRIAQQEQDFIAGIVVDANGAYRNGDYVRAVELYGDALELIPPISATNDQLIAQLTDAGFRINRQGDLDAIQQLRELVTRQESDLGRMAAIENELESTRTRAEQAELELEIIPVLEAEIETLQIAASETSLELKKIPILEGELASAQAKVERTTIELEQIPLLEAELESMRAAAQQAAVELARLKLLETELSAMEAAAEETAEQLAAMEAAAEQDAERLAAMKAAAELDAERAAERLAATQAAAEQEAEKNAMQLEQIPLLTAEIETLRATIEKNAPDLERIPALESQIETLREESEKAAVELAEMQSLKEALEEELATLRDRAAEMATELETMSELEAEIAAIKTEAAESALELERIPVLEEEISRLRAEAEEDAETLLALQDLQIENDRLKAAETELREETAALTSEVERLKSMEESYLKRQQLIEELSSFRSRYVERIDISDVSATDEATAALELLETKLLVKRIMVSEPVRTMYPDLYDQMELYLEELMENQRAETRVETLADINKLIDGVLSKQSMSAALANPFEEAAGQDEFLGLIDRLNTLLE